MPPQNSYQIKTVAAIGSMTAAIRAQRALQAVSIFSEVVSLLPSETHRGCAYGIEFATEQENAARLALRRERIRVSQYIRKESP